MTNPENFFSESPILGYTLGVKTTSGRVLYKTKSQGLATSAVLPNLPLTSKCVLPCSKRVPCA
jgi:hypothetical protein